MNIIIIAPLTIWVTISGEIKSARINPANQLELMEAYSHFTHFTLKLYLNIHYSIGHAMQPGQVIMRVEWSNWH